MSLRPSVVFWLLLTVIVIWEIINAFIDPGITLGEALGILATLLLAAIAGIFILCKTIRNAWPFKMRFSYQPPADTKRKILQRNWIALTGERELHLRIDTRVGIEISEFTVRFVKGLPPLFVDDADPKIVNITDVTVYGWAEAAERERNYTTGANDPHVEPFEPGGRKVWVHNSKKWPAGEPLWISLKVESMEPWTGFLSFRCPTDHRASVRRLITFRKKW